MMRRMQDEKPGLMLMIRKLQNSPVNMIMMRHGATTVYENI